MGEAIEFNSNYSDESTEKSFQFEFTCGRRGNGTKTSFRQARPVQGVRAGPGR
jgi:hypothetical protein